MDQALTDPDTTSKAPSPSESEESESESEVDDLPILPSSAPVRGSRASLPGSFKPTLSQPPRFNPRRSVAPVVSLKNLTQDYVRSAITAKATTPAQSRPSTVGTIPRRRYADNNSEEEEEEESSED